MPKRKKFVTPFILPIFAFAVAIFVGGLLLHSSIFCVEEVSVVDAFFIATSAVCVTGLSPFDVFAVFNRGGQLVVLLLMQLGGLGIITYTTLIFHLLRKRISLRDRLAVEQGLFYNPEFSLGSFIKRIVLIVLSLEFVGFLLIFVMGHKNIGIFEALFLSVSAFCNAGFAPWADSLEFWSADWGVTSAIMGLILLGGLGFFVLDDIFKRLMETAKRIRHPETAKRPAKLSFYSRVVLQTSLLLLLFGTLAIFFTELFNENFAPLSLHERLLAALFETVTSRTAGFATTNQAHFSDITLLIVIFLMFIGGSPGSCAGGIKATTFRILLANLFSKLQGGNQTVISNRAIDNATVNKAMILFCYAVLIIVFSTFILVLTENGVVHHGGARIPFFDLFFEVVSAFATVGLSINVTPMLSEPGKIVLCVVMFIGKLGPVWIITAIQQFQSTASYKYAETTIPVG